MMKGILALLVLLLAIGCTEAPEANAPEQTTEEEPKADPPKEKMKEDTPQEEMKEEPMEETPKEEMKEDPKEEPKVDNAKNELLEIFAAKVEFMVVYDVTAVVDGKTSTSQMTQYMKGTKMRTDVETQGIAVRTYMLGDIITSCNDATGGWMCNEMEMQEADASEQVKENAAEYDITKLADRTVAGTKAECYRITTKDGTVDYCYAEGVPLYIETKTAQADSTVVATSYSKKVADSVFEIPASEPMDMGNFQIPSYP
ncbi:DUF4412 domain-containing protein [Candidatus Woesearchaeota archaeon]|nr:DUF4412 domain-containing protein [Candidatus Woesearchaeota archaeon]